jgi:hypothetical protein
MTDRDRPAASFLERWSRKKIAGEHDPSGAPVQSAAEAGSPSDRSGLPERSAESNIKAPSEASPKTGFDLASLPSLESITAATDIRAFLAPGVPKDLARAALRRAWSADPAIRDFVGLAENAWDFNDPTAIPGFGALPPDYDSKKMLAQIFGDRERPAAAQAQAQQPADMGEGPVGEGNALPPAAMEFASPAPSNEKPDALKLPPEHRQVAQSALAQRGNNIASHDSIADDEMEEPKHRRRHGGALPQ